MPKNRLIFALLVLVVVSCLSFVFLNKKKGPFELDYNRISINLPVAYKKDLMLEKYPLGEKYLAENLLYEFKKLGFEVKLSAIEDVYLSDNYKEGFEFYMRSYPELMDKDYKHFFDSDKIAILYETIPYKISEVKNADIVFTGSYMKNEEYRKEGINSYFIPQFTNFDRFYPAYREDLKTKVLFVGNLWPDKESRKSVEYALRNGIEIDVYGASWDDVLVGDKKKYWKDMQIKNEDLKYYYSSADIVLNDTRQDMIDIGFISNRIYDATACKAFVISDYIEGIEKIYGDSIVMYKNEKEFKELIEYYLAHPEKRMEKAKKAYEITKKNFGADKIVKKMADIIREYAVEKNKK